MKRNRSKRNVTRSDDPRCYESTLTAKELDAFHERLLSDLKLREARAVCVPWRTGKFKGALPDIKTVLSARIRCRLDAMLQELSQTTQLMEGTRAQLNALLKGTEHEEIIDQAMVLIGQEVISLTLKGINPMMRNATAKLLLKRADQHRVDRRLDLVEDQLKQAAPPPSADPKTAKAKEAAVKQILGITE